MIRTAGQLFDALRERESTVLGQVGDVEHQGMIGDMYEGLSADLLSRFIPDGLDIRVVGGKVRKEDGGLSGQIDVMVTVGDGERLPFTDHYIYPESQVVAVFEIKKTLTGRELADAVNHLKSVSGLTDDTPVPLSRLRASLRTVLGIEMPRNDVEIDALSPFQGMVFHSLLADAVRPVRIVLAYGGYRTESGLRDGFIRYIQGYVPEAGAPPARGFGPADFPNLLICENLSIVKLNGMPLAARASEPETWPCFGSAHAKSGVLLLEVLWTRLSSFLPGLAPGLLGDDLTIEATYPLLLARVKSVMVNDEPRLGWVYESLEPSAKQLRAGLPDTQWNPAIVSAEVNATISAIGQHDGRLDLNDPEFRSWLTASSISFDAHIENLLATDLVWIEEGRWLRSLADEINTVFLPDGRIAVANSSDPRLARWVEMQHKR